MLVHSRPLVYRDDAFGRWRSVAQGAVRPDRVVVATPPFDQDLSRARCSRYPQSPPKTWIFLVLSGLATGASWLCYFRALQIRKVSQVAPIDLLSVVLAAVIAAVFLGQKLSMAGWGGVGLIGLGAVLVALA